MPSNHLMLCHPVLLLPSIFPSNWVFSNELALHIRWPEYWSFSINPFNEYSGLIPFRIDWFYLLVSLLADISACLRGFLVKRETGVLVSMVCINSVSWGKFINSVNLSFLIGERK